MKDVETDLLLVGALRYRLGAARFRTFYMYRAVTTANRLRYLNSVPEVYFGTWPGHDQVTTEPDRDGRVENPCLPGTKAHGRGISVHCLSERKSPTYAKPVEF
jgi:hypothetical protein